MRSTPLCLVVVSSLLLTACASTLPPGKATAFDRRCLPASMDLRRMPLSDMDQPAATTRSVERQEAVKLYSKIAVHVADVMDVLPLLNHLARLENQQAPSAEIERARRKLTTRLQLANMEVSSLVAEIECEVQRADEVQDRLKQVQSTRTTTQTILGIIAGGLANILSGGIGMAARSGDAADIASVAGGTLEVLFGTSANFTKVRQEFTHPHNHLEAFWNGEGKEKEFFSPGVWRFLTEPDIRDLEGHSLRDVLVQTWNEEGRLGEPGSRQEKARKALLFGEGGLYDSDDLHVREAMLHQLESSIQLMHQDLETLLREVLLRQALEEDRDISGRAMREANGNAGT